MKEWNNSPVITSVDNIETPLTDVQFPTMTICHEPQYQADNWALAEMILNFFEFNCNGALNHCSNTETLRKDFQPFLEKIFDIVNSEIDRTSFDEDSLKKLVKTKDTNIIVQSILSNLTSVEELLQSMKNSLGKFSSRYQFIKMFVPKTNSTVPCSSNCKDLYEKVRILLFKVHVMKKDQTMGYGFGTLLRNFAPMLGISFDFENMNVQSNRKISFCKMPLAEQNFHHLMREIGSLLGVEASLFDFPNFFKVSSDAKEEGEPRLTYPLYTLCEKQNQIPYTQDDYLSSCSTNWASVIDKSNVSMLNNYCGIDSSGLHGSDLAKVMKIIKFASHKFSKEDVEDFFSLLNGSSIRYPLTKSSYNVKNEIIKHGFQRPYIVNFKGFSPSFQAVLTNNGLCSSWNHGQMTGVFKDSEYLDIFKKSFMMDEMKTEIKPASIKTVTIHLDKHGISLPDRKPFQKAFW